MLLSVSARTLIGGVHPLQHPVAGEPAKGSPVPHWMRALDDLRPMRAFVLGALLLIVSPANVAVYLSALQGLEGTDLGSGRLVLLIVLILAIDLCILIPIAVYVAIPGRAQAILARAKAWLLLHQRSLMAWVFAVFGVLLVASAVAQLA